MSTTDPTAILALRPATDDDTAIVVRLAALDSSPVPAGDLLLGIVDGQPLAALSLATGQVVADPFAPTAELVGLLRQRASRLRPVREPGRPLAAGRLRLRRRISVA